ncbi:hypothetical protein Q8A67_025228 [Cirrhinus molitorella]|uniref:Uncharacterized protein n=1 Tax=Cirrhinus molitorella TaxID=172907 RepID=A0AA88NZ78_9TELE|nr:hypothetical protein Q8A67_025228 [Cirrhinus molitorella]
MRIKCVAAVANSRSGTDDGEREAELHQSPSFSAVPPSPAKRVCVCHSGGRESRPPAGPHLGNAKTKRLWVEEEETWRGIERGKRGERTRASPPQQCSCPAGSGKTTAGSCTAVPGVGPVTSA